MQNPDIYSTPTDGSLELLYGARANYTSSPEFKAQDEKLMLKAWRNFCYWGLQGYAKGLTDRPAVCIKSRGIGIHYSWYSAFFGENDRPVKILCMVRDMRQIFSSMEKLFLLNQERHQAIQNHASMTGTTTAKRIDSWLNTPPVGLAIERLQQIIADKNDSKILFIRAEDLTASSDNEMKRIYNYLELPYFKHDFNNVEQYTTEDDEVYGLTKSLHKIRNKVELPKRDYLEILGKEVSEWINGRFEWYQKGFKYI
jgi:sulfotransferase